MSEPLSRARPVSRLIDIQVEEVSLVDRAANQRRFLIVKRSEPDMAEPTPEINSIITGLINKDQFTELDAELSAEAEHDGVFDLDTGLDGSGNEAPQVDFSEGSKSAQVASTEGSQTSSQQHEPLLSTAINALEGLASALEQMMSVSGGVELTQGPSADLAEGTAERTAENTAETSAENTSGHSTTERDAEPETLPAQPSPPEPPGELARSLETINTSLRALAEMVRGQQQRLSRVEKQFGLPHSASSPEMTRKAAPRDVGWPMDLNNPMDRESVDKAISFHDL